MIVSYSLGHRYCFLHQGLLPTRVKGTLLNIFDGTTSLQLTTHTLDDSNASNDSNDSKLWVKLTCLPVVVACLAVGYVVCISLARATD